ncbi:MAG: hypothetical protein FWH20_01265 [Oscillospiraceae bacterium]|nr:hypothetical protein [Oscillospiraceae bacterium]
MARKTKPKEKSFEMRNPLTGARIGSLNIENLNVENLVNKEISDDGYENIEHQIEFFKYCHERIDGLKMSVYHRASIIMVVLAFVVSAFITISINILNDYTALSNIEIAIFRAVSIVFLFSFFATTFFVVFCLIPVESKILAKWFQKKSGKERVGKVHAYTAPKYILTFSYDDYEKAANKIITSKDVLEELVHGIYSLSTVTDFRYDLLKFSYVFLFINILSFINMISFLFSVKIL